VARPLEFEYVVESKDPRSAYERLLSARPSDAAQQTLREAEKLDMSLLREPDRQTEPK
jgi:hypothetical protein